MGETGRTHTQSGHAKSPQWSKTLEPELLHHGQEGLVVMSSSPVLAGSQTGGHSLVSSHSQQLDWVGLPALPFAALSIPGDSISPRAVSMDRL